MQRYPKFTGLELIAADTLNGTLPRGIDDYERLHGPVKPKRKKGVDSILK